MLTPALRVVSESEARTPLILMVRADDSADDAPADPVPLGEVADAAPATEPESDLDVVDGEWEDAFWSEVEPDLAENALGVEEAELVAADAVERGDLTSLEAGTDSAELEELIPFTRLTAVTERAAPDPEAGADAQLGPASAAEGLAASDMTQILTDQDGNPVTVLDEDSLKQIVRLLIREELQGVLGERITHNVRKLVRAEINRALTAQSLE